MSTWPPWGVVAMSRRITVEELTRVEGHGGLEVVVEGGVVKEARFNVHEGPRFFEHAVKTMGYEKVPDVTRRICAICTASHSLASIGAIEAAFGVEVSDQTKALRRLLMLGEIIESHALHVFLLALPDYLGYPDAIQMASAHGEAVKGALQLKKAGNLIHNVLSGREVHGMNERVGGFSRLPSPQQLEEVGRLLEAVAPVAELGVELLSGFEPPGYNDSENVLMALEPYYGYGYLGEVVQVSDGMRFHQSQYLDHIEEGVYPHTYAKFSLYGGQSFMVGSLPRLVLNHGGLKGRALSLYRENRHLVSPGNSMCNNLAQALELVQCVEDARRLVEGFLSDGLEEEGLAEVEPASGRGVNAVEAPRGVLYHDYVFDEEGVLAKANIVTPTAQNGANIEKDAMVVAGNLAGAPEGELVKALEMMARAYDPCISCSVHLVRVE